MAWRDKAKLYVCDVLTRLGALRFGVFRLTSGKMSPYYIDLRLLPSEPKAFSKVCGIYLDLVRQDVGLKNFDRIVGIPTAGIPFASVIAYQAGKPFLYIRREAKLHGRERLIEGVLNPGDRVLIVDDLITTGKSMLDAALKLRAEGAIVEDAVVLIDRNEGGEAALSKEGIKLHRLLDITETAKILHTRGVVDKESYEAIIKQIKK